MPATVAFNSSGSQLAVKRSATFDLIPYVKGFSIPSPKQVFDETTNLDSPSGFPERISVGKDFASTSFDVVWDPTNHIHQFLERAADASTQLDFQATVSNAGIAAVYTFSAFVDYDRKLEHRKAGVVTIMLNVTGDIPRTA